MIYIILIRNNISHRGTRITVAKQRVLSPGALQLWWAFAQHPEFLFIANNYSTAGRTNNTSILKLAHDPDSGLDSGADHIGDLLSGEREAGTKL